MVVRAFGIAAADIAPDSGSLGSPVSGRKAELHLVGD